MLRELDNDQGREVVNTRQRFDALQAAERKSGELKGTMYWMPESGTEYLVRSAYDRNGIRRNHSLGVRSADTEQLKSDYEAKREAARQRVQDLKASVSRQAGKNRAIGLGRMPLIGARIVRAIDAAGLLGRGIRIVGTNALYSYEAGAGIFIPDHVMETDDIDLLFDARQRIRLSSPEPIAEGALLRILRRVDRSFERSEQTFRAINRDGYLVDLIKPAPRPSWRNEREQLEAEDKADLVAAGIDGLHWLQSVSPFDAVVIDEKGAPLRMVVPDPRAFAIHKYWLSKAADRQVLKRRRDRAQAEVVAELTRRYFPHLPYEPDQLGAVPLKLFEDAKPLFAVLVEDTP
jgi:hypothetical protein